MLKTSLIFRKLKTILNKKDQENVALNANSVLSTDQARSPVFTSVRLLYLNMSSRGKTVSHFQVRSAAQYLQVMLLYLNSKQDRCQIFSSLMLEELFLTNFFHSLV